MAPQRPAPVGLHTVSARLPVEGKLASFDGATGWLNSPPLTAADLAGKVVVVNFWTFTCINWIRQLPHVRAWAEKYGDHDVVVIGVHAPEFGFEHSRENVLRAVHDMRIDYPVAIDNDYAVWSAFDNHYWPALYFADETGLVRHHYFGEGEYDQSEMVLQQMLVDARLTDHDHEVVPVEALGVEAPADWDHLRTPETYLGGGRGVGRHDHERPESLNLNDWALTGQWAIGREYARLDRGGGSIAYRFLARDAHLVLSSGATGPIPFRVLLDGEAPGESHGLDVDDQGRGVLRDGRLYQLVRVHDTVRPRTLEITFLEPGAEAYAFTFG
ncbi:redoxin domain-containing protein [Actinoplanes solisilvae]|uniref:redoxin domain-containing protein n=1 Tax=Actinoplanes solisilvae TaxID=2486853 RepID=UPI000FD89BD4|nr:redoxin domain-containing protein [Actinoplanes solisilvae]